MPKFVVSVLDRYEIEADSFDEAELIVRAELVDGSFTSGDFLDGSVNIERIDEDE